MAISGVLPSHVLVHVATPLRYSEDEPGFIEGEPGYGPEPEQGKPFVCVLFMPSAGGEVTNEYRPRAVRTPQMLYNPSRTQQGRPGGPSVPRDGSPVVVGNEDELLIYAPELAPWTGAPTTRWQADGEPQPFGKPGTVMGILAIVRQITD
jgi:hypothetical protein